MLIAFVRYPLRGVSARAGMFKRWANRPNGQFGGEKTGRAARGKRAKAKIFEVFSRYSHGFAKGVIQYTRGDYGRTLT